MIIQATIPTEWKDITLGTFQRVYKMDTLSMVSELLGITRTQLDDIAIDDLIHILNEFHWMDEMKAEKNYTSFILDGKEYELIDITKLTTDEWKILHSIEDNKSILDNLHILMAILYRPVKRKLFRKVLIPFDLNTYMDRAKEFQNKLTMDKVNTASLFIQAFGIEYSSLQPEA